MVERLSRTDVLESWYIETAVSLLEESNRCYRYFGTAGPETPLLRMVR